MSDFYCLHVTQEELFVYTQVSSGDQQVAESPQIRTDDVIPLLTNINVFLLVSIKKHNFNIHGSVGCE